MIDRPKFRSTCLKCGKVIEPGEPMKHIDEIGWLHSWCADAVKSKLSDETIYRQKSHRRAKRSFYADLYDIGEVFGYGDDDW